MGTKLTPIPVLQDNYVWVVSDSQQRCIIVDPGAAEPILEMIAAKVWDPQAILLTHHHADHVAGVEAIRQHFPNLPVYGPAETAAKGATQLLTEGESVEVMDLTFQVITTPGHTLGHISYYCAPYLFCGDTLFSGGCGRLFEGTPLQMYHSLAKLNALPAETLVCAAHEYTEANLAFAVAQWPNNSQLLAYQKKTVKLRKNKQISLPTTLQKEREINPFLNTQDPDLIRNVMGNTPFDHGWQVFAELRRLKDSF